MDFSRRRNRSKLEGPSSTLIDISARDVNVTVFCDNGKCTDRLQEAHDEFQDVGESLWLTLDQIKEFSKPANFVCDPFEGELFEYLLEQKLPTYGPLVILRCLRDKRPLPLAVRPVYSQAMKDVIVTFSSVAAENRVRLTQRVEYMGGRVEAPLNNTVTHVVCDEVGSKKYIVGSLRGLALQTTAWIDEVWDRVQHDLKHAISVADEYKTPVFANLAITSSGLDEAEKEKLKQLVTQNGGTYTGKLTKTNTHLVIKEPIGAKYKAAVSWQLHVVSPEWIHESMNKGFMIDPAPYHLTDQSSASCQGPMNSSISSIASTVVSSRSVLSERTNHSDPMYSEILKLTKEDLASAAQILDGCTVHVYGIREKALQERLEQIINVTGGLREDAFNDGVTHVITLPSASGLLELQKNIENSFSTPSVALPSWLAACVRRKTLLHVGPYTCPGFDPPPDNDITCVSSVASVAPVKEQTGSLIDKNFFLTEGLYDVFPNIRHDLPALKNGVEALGGRLVESVDGIEGTTYNVYPMMVSGAELKPNAITILHLETVINQKRWIPPTDSQFYTVIHAPKVDLPNAFLADVVVTPTGFSEHQVASLEKVLSRFNGTLQASMVKTSKPEKQLAATTHLICATENPNSKVEAAKRWKVPAVTLNWLLACAREGRKVSVKDYLIEKKQWETLPEDKRKASPKKSACDTPLDHRKRPIELQTSQIVSEIQSDPSNTPNGNRASTSAAQTPVLSSQRMREIYEEASRFKTPKTSAVSDVDSPGVPCIGSERIAEMIRNIQESPHPYPVPDASFDERNSQAISVKTALSKSRPLEGIVVLLDEESLQPLGFELKMSIERLGGWVCHTMERCSVMVTGLKSANDNSRALIIRAQRLEKPIVGVEWIYATIDNMQLQKYEDFPVDYEVRKGKYVRAKTFKDYEKGFDDSDVDVSISKVVEKGSEETKVPEVEPVKETFPSPQTRSATLRRHSTASTSSNTSTPTIPATPLAASGGKMAKDPLRDLIFKRSNSSPTSGRAQRYAEDEPRSLLKKSQIMGLQQQDSSGSVLADIETQPEEGITYGGRVGIPTSTQLLSTTSDEHVDPNFGDLSIVKQPADFLISPERNSKRLWNEGDDDSVGKRLKKNDFPSAYDSRKILSNDEKVFVLYHLKDDVAAKLRGIISSLGGSVIEDLSSDTFTENSSHRDPLMVIDPDNHKVFKKKSVLQQLASGGWILEPKYLEDSKAKGHFLDENDYVVGVGLKSCKVNDSRFACWRRWRQQRLERGTGAFDGWKVVLYSASAEREKGHRTLLMAGGATVLSQENVADATHVFLAKSDSVTAKKLRTIVSANAKVLANEYMLHYLSNAEVDPEQFYIA